MKVRRWDRKRERERRNKGPTQPEFPLRWWWFYAWCVVGDANTLLRRVHECTSNNPPLTYDAVPSVLLRTVTINEPFARECKLLRQLTNFTVEMSENEQRNFSFSFSFSSFSFLSLFLNEREVFTYTR